MSLPTHVAIILDGNGRWAKEQGKPRTYGHKEGAKTMLRILEDADELGIKYLTVYAFSTENWNRPKMEVAALMTILRNELISSIDRSMKNNVRCRVIGDRKRLSDDINEAVRRLETATSKNTGLQFTIAINYGGRDEITRTLKSIVRDCLDGKISVEDINEMLISEKIDTHDIPDPDLIIRTCGEQRISNFLLWQCAYSEFYYTDKSWPDFDREELKKALDSYGTRQRRYGGVSV